MIALRNEFAAFSRRADAKIGLLKEIIERVQKGEDVDVEGLLGTGNKAKEQEWEEVLREIEREDKLWVESQQKKPAVASGIKVDKKKIDRSAGESVQSEEANGAVSKATSETKSKTPSSFY